MIPQNFKITDILKKSVFYPASGNDMEYIKYLLKYSKNFVHVDYSVSMQNVKTSLEEPLKTMGYELSDIKEIAKNKITPNINNPYIFPFNEHEQKRLSDPDIKNCFDQRNFEPFALWALYKLKNEGPNEYTPKTLSLLHIGGEAIATFNSLYLQNRINPEVVVILRPAEGYGDNWTLFTNPGFRFYQLLQRNIKFNNQVIPKYVLTDSDKDECFWPDFSLKDTFNENNRALKLFEHNSFSKKNIIN